MRPPRPAAFLLAVLAAAACAAAGPASPRPKASPRPAQASPSPKAGKEAPVVPLEDKLDATLAGLEKAWRTGAQKSFDAFAEQNRLERVEDRVRVEIVVTSVAEVAAVKKAIAAHGGQVETEAENRVYASLPGRAIAPVGGLAQVWSMAAARPTSFQYGPKQ